MIVQRSILIDGNTYTYEFERKKIRNINLRIRSDGSIYVSAPKATSDKAVLEFLERKKDFIVSAISKTNERHGNNMRPVSFECGENVKVFGKIMQLVVRSAPVNDVLLRDGYIFIYVKNVDDRELTAKVYNKWRCEQLKRKVLALCEEICPEFVKLGAKVPTQIKFRTMKSRWGSCKPKEGVLTFNYNLFEVPEECVRYVVVHEFAHLLVADHSNRFYRFVALVMPDWREKRRMLNEY